VDVTAEDLQERLRQGKVYPPDRAERAITNFFTADNLGRLRELTLEEIAAVLDRRRQRASTPADSASDRVMVCFSSGGPNVPRLLRKGARLADRFHAPWYAVFVRTPSERDERTDAASQRRVADALALARQLGGVPLSFSGPTFQAAVAAFVREYAITHVVLGRTGRPWYHRWFGQSPLDRLLAVVPTVDVTLVDVR
jgi:two-component system, OmpR family, sensor histidine kinase KdpD